MTGRLSRVAVLLLVAVVMGLMAARVEGVRAFDSPVVPVPTDQPGGQPTPTDQPGGQPTPTDQPGGQPTAPPPTPPQPGDGEVTVIGVGGEQGAGDHGSGGTAETVVSAPAVVLVRIGPAPVYLILGE